MSQALLLWALPQIFAIDPQARSRISGQLFLSAYLGAAACSAVSSANWSGWGWNGAH